MFGNGRSESSPVGNLPIVIHLDASQVRHARILECVVKTRLLAKYQGNADNPVYLLTQDMGLGNNPIPSSPSSACSEANEKATPQVYKGHGKENVDGLSFFGHKSEYVVSGSDNG
ncbi:hypothetical protein V6N13_063833 [Hibiscus sabdariffa]